MKKINLLLIMFILGLLGLGLSIYLVQHHYALAHETGFCDFSSTVSCSLVNRSSYAELFHIPVAFYGVLWFLVFLAGILMVWKRKHHAKKAVLFWCVSGLLFVFYLLYAEWQVGAICPWCTIVHLDIFLLVPLAILLYRRQ